MPLATREDRSIHYQWTPATKDSAQDRPPVLLIPGLGGSSKIFGTLPRRFARSGRSCITLDPVGFGKSSAHHGDYDLTAAGADVFAVIDALELEAVDIVGTSLGGKVALAGIAHAPDRCRRMVLLASAAVPTARARRVFRFFELLSSRLEGTELAEVLATFLFGTTFHTNHAEMIDDIIRSMTLDVTTRDMMVRQAKCLQDFDGRDWARSVPCPTLCLAGAEDTLTGTKSIEATADLLAKGEFEIIENAGHTLLLESRLVFDRILAFLAK